MGDTAVIDFEGFDDGKPFEGGKGEDYSLEIGSGSFVPGFEDQLIGLKAGDEKDLDITFPEDYVPDLAGKSVVFKVKVKEVKGPQAPEVDDEFAKDVSEFETLADFKKDLGEKLQQRRTAEAQNDFESAVLDQTSRAPCWISSSTTWRPTSPTAWWRPSWTRSWTSTPCACPARACPWTTI